MDWIAVAKTLSKTSRCESFFATLAVQGLALAGQAGDKGKWSVKLSDGSLVSMMCNHSRWWDFDDQTGGQGPVAAAQHVLGITAPEAARWIVERVEGCPVALAFRESLEIRQASEAGVKPYAASPKRV